MSQADKVAPASGPGSDWKEACGGFSVSCGAEHGLTHSAKSGPFPTGWPALPSSLPPLGVALLCAWDRKAPWAPGGCVRPPPPFQTHDGGQHSLPSNHWDAEATRIVLPTAVCLWDPHGNGSCTFLTETKFAFLGAGPWRPRCCCPDAAPAASGHMQGTERWHQTSVRALQRCQHTVGHTAAQSYRATGEKAASMLPAAAHKGSQSWISLRTAPASCLDKELSTGSAVSK